MLGQRCLEIAVRIKTKAVGDTQPYSQCEECSLSLDTCPGERVGGKEGADRVGWRGKNAKVFFTLVAEFTLS